MTLTSSSIFHIDQIKLKIHLKIKISGYGWTKFQEILFLPFQKRCFEEWETHCSVLIAEGTILKTIIISFIIHFCFDKQKLWSLYVLDTPLMFISILINITQFNLAKSAGAVHYTDCISAEGWVSWIWHETIWWRGSSNAGALGNAEYSFIAIALRSILVWSWSIW